MGSIGKGPATHRPRRDGRDGQGRQRSSRLESDFVVLKHLLAVGSFKRVGWKAYCLALVQRHVARFEALVPTATVEEAVALVRFRVEVVPFG